MYLVFPADNLISDKIWFFVLRHLQHMRTLPVFSVQKQCMCSLTAVVIFSITPSPSRIVDCYPLVLIIRLHLFIAIPTRMDRNIFICSPPDFVGKNDENRLV